MFRRLLKLWYGWRNARAKFLDEEAARIDAENQKLDRLGEEELETMRRLSWPARARRNETKRIDLTKGGRA